MLGWFRALMPREERFFDLFSRHDDLVFRARVTLGLEDEANPLRSDRHRNRFLDREGALLLQIMGERCDDFRRRLRGLPLVELFVEEQPLDEIFGRRYVHLLFYTPGAGQTASWILS